LTTPKAFSETDQTEDLKAIKVPTLVMQGTLQRRRAASGQAAQERHAEGLSRLPARDVHDECRRDQFRPARFHTVVIAIAEPA
jgi:hypothetical protein